ncbi:unnamed protein product [Rhizophagus irregularis]|nr:unnamed protein product [Rhizophagus irregularis]
MYDNYQTYKLQICQIQIIFDPSESDEKNYTLRATKRVNQRLKLPKRVPGSDYSLKSNRLLKNFKWRSPTISSSYGIFIQQKTKYTKIIKSCNAAGDNIFDPSMDTNKS